MSTINPITSATASASSTNASTGANSLSDPNTFLKLLVAELKYQNPLNPSDPNQYLAQTAQFSMVQKINDLDSQMTAMLKASQEAAGAALIGRQVTGTTTGGDPVTGVVSSLQASASGVDLLVGGKAVPIADVTAISGAASAATAATSASTDTTTPSTSPTQPA